tara:strand:+ start:455 stop:793 length:339 start_codon:yes stop_codon:yes gene_type:complete
MTTTTIERDRLAKWYAQQHYRTDPGVVEVFYLPANSGEREIRLVEVNELIGERCVERLSAVDFGVDFGTENQHSLWVADVTPKQLPKVQNGEIELPDGWSWDNSIRIKRRPS